jgi:uncharacterized protein YabE (DUF348 family)
MHSFFRGAWVKLATPGVKFWTKLSRTARIFSAAAVLAVFGIGALGVGWLAQNVAAGDTGQTIAENANKMVTIYDDGLELDTGQSITIRTRATTVADALKEAKITLSEHDSISPKLDAKLSSGLTNIQIRRARPVTVIDGARQIRVITAAQSPRAVAEAAGVPLASEDAADLSLIQNVVAAGGGGLELNIQRAQPLTLQLYGQPIALKTRAKTVGDLLKEKDIQLAATDTINVALKTPISAGMTVQIWREGANTIRESAPLPFTTKEVKDDTKNIGYREVQTAGVNGEKTVMYSVVMHGGVEQSREQISEIVNKPAVDEVVVIGTKPLPVSAGALTKGKGVNQFTDSKGVTHRETYYDLDMSRVMTNCGQGGYYTVRSDGVKVDRDGYVIIAANLNRYPRCSAVETSVGPGKVYDTGGFASVHPDGWDIATDWSNYNGN